MSTTDLGIDILLSFHPDLFVMLMKQSVNFHSLSAQQKVIFLLKRNLLKVEPFTDLEQVFCRCLKRLFCTIVDRIILLSIGKKTGKRKLKTKADLRLTTRF